MSQSILLNPRTLLNAYSVGAFPMADPNGKIQWFMADPRGVLPLDKFHVPHTLAQLVKKTPREGGFDVRINHDFESVMRGCMEARSDHTWISEELISAYVELHQLGHAHSVECYQDNKLAGGLYGVSLGAAFFGESMFHRVRDASKVALVCLVRQLNAKGFELLDTQTVTQHLKRFGVIEIPAADYLIKLRAAITKPREFV